VHAGLVHRSAVTSRFGNRAFDDLSPLLVRYESAVRNAGLAARVIVIDDPVSMSALGLQPAATSAPKAVRQVIRALHAALVGIGDRLDGVLLFGGDELFPMFRVTNVIDDRHVDPDDVIPTDNVFGALSDELEEWLAPTIAVGRVCDGGSLPIFLAAIEAVITNHQQRPVRAGSIAVINQEWEEASRDIAASLEPPSDFRLTPFFAVTETNRADLDRRLIYANLHGFSGEAAWKAFDPAGDRFIDVISPDSFVGAMIAGTVVISSACYGGDIAKRTPRTSTALRAHVEGAAAVFVATGLAFGSIFQPVLDVRGVDEFTHILVQESAQAERAGGLLTAARHRFANRVAGLRAFEVKILLQFVLLGDPALALS
jgi:hypothetical protein